MNGDFHKRRSVVGVKHFHALWEITLQVGKSSLDCLRRIQRVGTGSEFDPKPRGGLTIDFGQHIVVLTAKLNARHVPQPHLRAIRVNLQHHAAKLLRIFKPRLGDDRGVKLLTRHGWRAAELACRYLVILRFQLIDNVQRRELEVIHRMRIEPDAHGILRAKQLHVTDAVGTADGVFHI
ncbi:hypothetical protein BN129_3686 [Cronobacter sakazakii 701]|nr:hypothetical protein BN129_3686 [Cronobacter sakazakii 701]